MDKDKNKNISNGVKKKNDEELNSDLFEKEVNLPGDIAEELEPEVLLDDVEFVDSNEEGIEVAGSVKIKQLQDKLKVVLKERQEYLDGWQRARADYANLQKQTEEDKKRLRTFIEQNFIEELLPVIDSFDMAMNNKDSWEKVDINWRTGVEYIYSQLMNVLKDHDLEPFGSVGDTFDPNLHEAVSEKETDDSSADHTIQAVLQRGYKLYSSVVRPARVIVYKKVV